MTCPNGWTLFDSKFCLLFIRFSLARESTQTLSLSHLFGSPHQCFLSPPISFGFRRIINHQCLISFDMFHKRVVFFFQRIMLILAWVGSASRLAGERDRDRERAQARASSSKTKQPKNDGLTPEQRRERDAKALQEKAAKKAAQAAGGTTQVV
ncbi:hypothetical protein K1719_016743 [Acacia pycnantha]|nr:hypothetical protein K1719_016743 [Acacia pycnantha]